MCERGAGKNQFVEVIVNTFGRDVEICVYLFCHDQSFTVYFHGGELRILYQVGYQVE